MTAPSAILRQLGAVVAGAMMLCSVALWNGQPLFYFDTPYYVRGAEQGLGYLLGPRFSLDWLRLRPSTAGSNPVASAAPSSVTELPAAAPAEGKVVMSGRSPYYGGLLYAGYFAGGMWLSVILQALMVSYVIHLLMVRLFGLRNRAVVGVAGLLALLTPLGAYTGLLMPDVFASLLILLAGVLTVYWRRLPVTDRGVLAAILLFGISVHSSHLAIAALMLVALAAFAWLSPRAGWISLPGLAVVAACVTGAFVADWVSNRAVQHALGVAPQRYPFLTGHLVDMGPGTAYLQKHCPDVGYAACRFVQNYPTNWIDFLFSTDPKKGAFGLANGPIKRGLSAEQTHLFLDVLRYDPVGVVRGLAWDALMQVAMFKVDILYYGTDGLAGHAELVPEPLMKTMRSSHAASSTSMNRWLTIWTYVTALGSLLIFAGAAVTLGRGRRGAPEAPAARTGEQSRFVVFTSIVVAGVLVNAIVCGVLASPLDRFQARVVWLLPFLALVMVLLPHWVRGSKTVHLDGR